MSQDTGIVTGFVKVGMDVRWGGAQMGFTEMISEGVCLAYFFPEKILRASIVRPPKGLRKNTGDNSPAVVHCEIVPGDRVTELTSRLLQRAVALKTNPSFIGVALNTRVHPVGSAGLTCTSSWPKSEIRSLRCVERASKALHPSALTAR